MLGYLQALRPSSILHGAHWEHASYGEEAQHAVEYSVWMELRPGEGEDGGRAWIDRETAWFAVQQVCDLVDVHGALDGEMEVWAWGVRRGRVLMHVFEWPKGGGEEGRGG